MSTGVIISEHPKYYRRRSLEKNSQSFLKKNLSRTKMIQSTHYLSLPHIEKPFSLENYFDAYHYLSYNITKHIRSLNEDEKLYAAKLNRALRHPINPRVVCEGGGHFSAIDSSRLALAHRKI